MRADRAARLAAADAEKAAKLAALRNRMMARQAAQDAGDKALARAIARASTPPTPRPRLTSFYGGRHAHCRSRQLYCKQAGCDAGACATWR